jgi:hypothetical protein
VIIDKDMEALSQNGNPLSVEQYGFTIPKMGLDAIAIFEPSGIAALASTYVQPNCGPRLRMLLTLTAARSTRRWS